MDNIITTIFQKLKITKPSRNEKADYILMLDKDNEVCAVPEAAFLAKVNKRIDGIVYPDGFTKTSDIVISGNEISIPAGDFEWKIDLNPYSNALFEQTIEETSDPAYNRIDSLAATKENTIVYHQGVEVDETQIAIPPIIPSGQLHLTDIYVLGSELSEPVPPAITEVFTKEEKDKLGVLDKTADIDKPVSTAQAAADDDVLQDAKDYADTGLALKLNAADYNDRFKGKFLTEAAMRAAYPTANVGDEAQVNEVGSETVKNFSWDDELNDWVQSGSGGSGATNTDALPEGSTNLYFQTARVLATVLTGISFATGGAIVSTDTVLQAFGKIQKQINDLTTANVPDSTNKRYVTDAQQAVIGNTSGTNSGNETAGSIATINHGASVKTTLVDADEVYGGNSASSFSLIRTVWSDVWTYIKSKADAVYLVPQITITTSVSITTATNDASGFGQKGRNVVIDNSTNAINITVDGGTGFAASYIKHGTGTITFVQGSGRTLTQVDGTAVLNGAVGSTATISSVGTKDYLRISNV